MSSFLPVKQEKKRLIPFLTGHKKVYAFIVPKTNINDLLNQNRKACWVTVTFTHLQLAKVASVFSRDIL